MNSVNQNQLTRTLVMKGEKSKQILTNVISNIGIGLAIAIFFFYRASQYSSVILGSTVYKDEIFFCKMMGVLLLLVVCATGALEIALFYKQTIDIYSDSVVLNAQPAVALDTITSVTKKRNYIVGGTKLVVSGSGFSQSAYTNKPEVFEACIMKTKKEYEQQLRR